MRMKPPKASKSMPQYIVHYRKSSGFVWFEGIPTYDRAATRRTEAFYIGKYGEDNVRVEVLEKKPVRENFKRRDNDDGYE